MNNLHNLTNEELIRALQNRSDLTAVEHELLDRLIRAVDALAAIEISNDPRG